MVVVQKTNNMGRKLRVTKQKGKANKYFIGDKEVSEKKYVKTYTDAVNQGKKVNPDFKPTSVKELTSPATLKKESGFKLRSGNKPSIAKLAGISPLKDDKKNKPMDEPEEGMTEKELIEYNERLNLDRPTQKTQKEGKRFVRGAKGNVFK